MSFWCFVFLSRCLIYKVHATASQLSVRYILAHSLSLVKHFFRNFSAPSALIQARSPSRWNSFILPHSFESVKNFFRGFFRPFDLLNRFPVLFELVPLSRANSFSLPRSQRFVKNFFQSLPRPRPASARPRLSPDLIFPCPLVRRLLSITAPPSFVNTLFLFFRLFFSGVGLLAGTTPILSLFCPLYSPSFLSSPFLLVRSLIRTQRAAIKGITPPKHRFPTVTSPSIMWVS